MTRRVKVAHVVTRLELGGAQQNTLYTCAHLDPAAFDVLLVAGPGGILDAELAGASYRWKLLPSLVHPVRPLRDLLALLELTSLFLAEKPDVVHTHSSKAGVLGRLAAAAAGVPAIVHTFHGFGFHDRQSSPVRAAYVLAEKLAARVSDALVFVSRSNMDTARAVGLGRPERYELVRSGVALAGLPARVEDPKAKKASLGLGMHKPLVCSVGNFKPQKNPLDFLTAAAAVLQEVPDARFVFVGDGPLRPAMEARVLALGLDGKVALPGWRRDTAEILAVSDVFVLTSLWEGLPRALVEAMKSGLPPVCYATDGVVDLIRDGENGFVVPQGGATALAQRVVSLLKDEPLRKRLGAAAAASVGEEYDIDEMVRAQERLYDRLLA